MNYFLLGIKGSGMSALAKILYDKNNHVVGSDYETSFFTEHDFNDIEVFPLGTLFDNYIYIIGNAFVASEDHLEIIKRGYPHYRYAEFVGMLSGIGIAVSGTHGKTTTTALISHFFSEKKCDVLIGDGTGMGIVDNDYFIYEACEYRNTFLNYNPDYLIITNIEYEHTDFFSGIEEIICSFQKLAAKSQVVIVNGDCPNARKIKSNHLITFGFASDNDYVIKIIDDKYPKKISINHNGVIHYYNIPFYGKYMIYNTVAAIVVSLENGIEDMNKKINSFPFPKRRMTEYKFHDQIIIDDYAHHPTEIKNTLEAIKEKYQKDITLVFEPHTYSRTLDLEKDFVSCLSEVDDLYIANTFSSVREIYVKSKSRLVELIPHAKYFTSVKKLSYNPNRVLVFMGAGTIYENISEFMKVNENHLV